MNITGQYKKVWKIKENNGFYNIDLGDSSKRKDGTYESFTLFNVALLGNAKSQAQGLNEGDTIEVVNGIWTKKKSEKDGKFYDNIIIFDFEITQKGNGESVSSTSGDFELDDSDDLPY